MAREQLEEKNARRVVMGRGTKTTARVKIGAGLLWEEVREQLKEKNCGPSCYEKRYESN